jgi:hypothetical protein
MTPPDSMDVSDARRHNFGSIFGKEGIVFNIGQTPKQSKSATVKCSVNKFLWKGALDTFSFMPTRVASPHKGYMCTNWHVDPNRPDIRVRVMVQIFGRKLRADAVKVHVIRQKLERNTWVDYRLSKQECTRLEVLVVERARKLRREYSNS